MTCEPLQLHTWVFDQPGNDCYARLTRVFAYSCELNQIDCTVHRLPPPTPIEDRKLGFVSNHYKLRAWAEWLGDQPDGQHLLISDSDMICIRRPGPQLLDQTQCIGLTRRTGKPGLPINGGMIVVRTGPEARQFFNDWLEADDQLYAQPQLHGQWRQVCGGMNQASLFYMLDQHPEHRQLITYYQCSTMNLCNPWNTWRDSYFVHIKSSLRKRVFDRRDSMWGIVPLWHQLERAAKEHTRPDLPQHQLEGLSLADHPDYQRILDRAEGDPPWPGRKYRTVRGGGRQYGPRAWKKRRAAGANTY